MRSRLAPKFTWLFEKLRYVTLMSTINRLVPKTKGNDRFIDCYVIVFPFIALIVFSIHPFVNLSIFGLFLAIWKIYGILIYLGNTLLFDEYRAGMERKKPKPLGGHRRILILLLFNYFELIFWFALLYRSLIPSLSTSGIESWVRAVNLSFVMLSAFGSSSIELNCWIEILLSMVEAGIGLFMAVVVVSRFVSLLQRRPTADIIERWIERD